MIYAVLDPEGRPPAGEALARALGSPPGQAFAAPGVVLAGAADPGWGRVPQLHRRTRGEAEDAALVDGRLDGAAELARAAGVAPGAGGAELVLALYDRWGAEFPARLNGPFVAAIWDGARRRLLVARDHLGLERLYVQRGGGRLIVSSAIRPILRTEGVEARLDHAALRRVLVFNYNPARETLFAGISAFPPAHVLQAGAAAQELRRYWKPSFAGERSGTEAALAAELRERLRRSVELRLEPDTPPGVFLSGGMDSSTVLALAAARYDRPLRTFAYRCRGETYDESHHARRMAAAAGAEHDETEYTAADVLAMGQVVAEMHEPFCDLGINVATWILGRRARDRAAAYVLTGDGGDELFAGHPVYEADKIARIFDPLPAPAKRLLAAAGRLLPDSDQKKNAVVKLKRFSESLGYPRSLLSHRWRVYYAPPELRRLVTPELGAGLDADDPFRGIVEQDEGNDGRDALSRSLYNDYHTVVGFYLRRNDLIRRFGVETRFPLLDPELVDYCAAIPTRLKIRGWFDTKHILKQAMRETLPHEIVFRKDKLGHSIPLKRWIREEPRVREFVAGYLSAETVGRRGLFRPAEVERLLREHLERRRNNSHRLWTLAVVEMWLQHHVDGGPA